MHRRIRVELVNFSPAFGPNRVGDGCVEPWHQGLDYGSISLYVARHVSMSNALNCLITVGKGRVGLFEMQQHPVFKTRYGNGFLDRQRRLFSRCVIFYFLAGTIETFMPVAVDDTKYVVVATSFAGLLYRAVNDADRCGSNVVRGQHDLSRGQCEFLSHALEINLLCLSFTYDERDGAWRLFALRTAERCRVSSA